MSPTSRSRRQPSPPPIGSRPGAPSCRRVSTEHEAAAGRRLAPEIDQRGRGDRSGAEQKRAKPGPGGSEGQCGKGKCENERDRLADGGNLGALDDGSRQGSGREKIRRVLSRERDPG